VQVKMGNYAYGARRRCAANSDGITSDASAATIAEANVACCKRLLCRSSRLVVARTSCASIEIATAGKL
jgi:hypothetical protein